MIADAEIKIIITASDFPRFAWPAETFPFSKPAICKGVKGTFPTVNAFAVAYAEKPFAKSNKKLAIKLGKSRGKPINLQN